MDEVSQVSKVSNCKVETTAKLESLKNEAVRENDLTSELRHIEVKIEEETKHAFALVTEIRDQIEKAYNAISEK